MNRTIETNKGIGLFALGMISLIVSYVTSGCGGDSYRDTGTGVPTGTTVAGAPAPANPGTGGQVIVGPGAETTNLQTTDSVVPTITADFTVTGAGGSKPTAEMNDIHTNSLLKIKVISGPSTNNSVSYGALAGTYTNFSASYTCIMYKIEGLGSPYQTPFLALNGSSMNCPGAPSSVVVDMSSRLTAGHGAVNLTISAIKYDNACDGNPLCWSNGYYGGTLIGRSVYINHSVTGYLEIQTNGGT